jgi:DNA-binding NtrC family response regulator
MIRRTLKRVDGHVGLAAKALGISRKGLYLKRQRLGFDEVGL